jgi:hypothetical protein
VKLYGSWNGSKAKVIVHMAGCRGAVFKWLIREPGEMHRHTRWIFVSALIS